MQAIILAAGMGKRLKDLTNNNTKCMVKVNGVTMIERSLRILDGQNLSRIVIVEGYEGARLRDYIVTLNVHTPIIYIHNPIYATTNNIYSLALAKEYLCAEDTLLLESDLIYEASIIETLVQDPRPTLAVVDKFESWMDGTCMELDTEDCITDFIPGKHLRFSEKENYYKTVNIYKFSQHFSANTYVPFLSAYEKAMGENEYYESVIKLIAMLETREIRALRLTGQRWYEIDDIQDLDIAETLFAENTAEQYHMIASRYGGYWRYPWLRDYCYLVNPYFPPAKMLDEMQSNYTTLLVNYPSGMRVNTLLASNLFDVKQQHIVVGNGAAELIRSLMSRIAGKVGCVYPTFEEYPNRYDKTEIVPYVPTSEGYRYTASDLQTYYAMHPVQWLILINPDNPSGNYIPKDEVLELADWCGEQGIRLVVDESFVDFADCGEGESHLDHTLLEERILAAHPNLYIVKSISKSYGVPGIRLGVLASADEEMIAFLKKDVAIWNINSYGEFFLQTIGKYKKAYAAALVQIRENRHVFLKELAAFSWIMVYPSQANYVMCRLENGVSAERLCTELLRKGFLIKDLTSKLHDGHEYIRLAIKSAEDNAVLIEALKEIKI